MRHSIEETRGDFCPFKELDLHCAVVVLNEADVEETLYELCTKFSTELGIKLEVIDPVYIVYEHILQMTRNEIDDKIGVDICNDYSDSINVYSNHLDTHYAYSEETKDNIQELLKDNEQIEWSQTALWFFEQIEVDPFVGGTR